MARKKTNYLLLMEMLNLLRRSFNNKHLANKSELVKFTKPETFLSQQQNDINLILRNAGTSTLNAATINWSMNGQDDVYNWTGSLAPADRVELTLRANETIPTGQTRFIAHVNVEGDVYHQNDTIRRNSYIPKKFFMPYKCDFDETGYDDLCI